MSERRENLWALAVGSLLMAGMLLVMMVMSSCSPAMAEPVGSPRDRTCFVDGADISPNSVTTGNVVANSYALSPSPSAAPAPSLGMYSRSANTITLRAGATDRFEIDTGGELYCPGGSGACKIGDTSVRMGLISTTSLDSNGTNSFSGATPLNLTHAGGGMFCNNTAARCLIESAVASGSAGATTATAMVQIFPDNVLDATDWVLDVATVGNAASLFNVSYAGVATPGLQYSVPGSGNAEYVCTGGGTCNFNSANSQTADYDCGGGTCIAQLGASSATTTTIGRAGQTTDIKGGTITLQGTAMDFTFCVYNTGNLAGAVAFGETTFTHAVTVNTGSKVAQDVAGVGAGNFVVKLCTDGTTCAGGNTYLTYTEACTAAAGTRTAATVQNSGAIPAGSVGTISVATACATTDPAANICVHYTMP